MNTAYSGSQKLYAEPACEPQCADATDLDMIRNRLGEVLNFVQRMGERIDMMTDKLTGPRISVGKDGPNAPRPVPNGMVAEMSMRLDDIMSVLQRTDGAVSKLRGII